MRKIHYLGEVEDDGIGETAQTSSAKRPSLEDGRSEESPTGSTKARAFSFGPEGAIQAVNTLEDFSKATSRKFVNGCQAKTLKTLPSNNISKIIQ